MADAVITLWTRGAAEAIRRNHDLLEHLRSDAGAHQAWTTLRRRPHPFLTTIAPASVEEEWAWLR